MQAKLQKSFAALRSPKQQSKVFNHTEMAVMAPSPYHCQASEASAECPEEKETREDVCDHPPLLLCL